MKVHPRLAMELARHSDMRLTMKTYTDAGQLPLREVMDTLPGFGGRSDSRIDSRTLGKSGQTVSPSVTKIREIQTENSLENTSESHRDAQLVTMSPEKSEWRREGDSNPRYDSPLQIYAFIGISASKNLLDTSKRCHYCCH